MSKPKTQLKSRITGVSTINNILFYLLAHPCGELLIIADDQYGCLGACLWGRAVIRWSEDKQRYVMCKYGMHDQKFDLRDFNDQDCEQLATLFAIEYYPKNQPRFLVPVTESLMAMSLLTWMSKHPKMATQFENYADHLQGQGVTPLPDMQYSGN